MSAPISRSIQRMANSRFAPGNPNLIRTQKGPDASDGARELRAAFKRIERELPPRLASAMRWLRHPDSRWVRLPAGIALVIGGIFSILPFLGIWMLPLGLMMVAADVPFLRRPMARLTMWGADKLDSHRARKRR